MTHRNWCSTSLSLKSFFGNSYSASGLWLACPFRCLTDLEPCLQSTHSGSWILDSIITVGATISKFQVQVCSQELGVKAQLSQYLPKNLLWGPGFNLSHYIKLSVVTHTSHPRIWEVDARESEAEGHSQIYTELEASLGHMKPCFKTNKQQLGNMFLPAFSQVPGISGLKPNSRSSSCHLNITHLFSFMTLILWILWTSPPLHQPKSPSFALSILPTCQTAGLVSRGHLPPPLLHLARVEPGGAGGGALSPCHTDSL